MRTAKEIKAELDFKTLEIEEMLNTDPNADPDRLANLEADTDILFCEYAKAIHAEKGRK